MNMKRILFLIALLSTHSFALVGAGFHWGVDMSTRMDDTEMEALEFGIGDLLDEFNLDGDHNIMYANRTNFEAGNINFGGKAYVDPPLLPFSIETSINFGSWLYDGSITYIDPQKLEDLGPDDITDDNIISELYSTQPITMASLSGEDYFGLDQTPYGKLQLDLSIKKDLSLPIISPQFGLGPSVHFETPVLSRELIENALDMSQNPQNIIESIDDPDNRKKILDEITDGAKEPKVGMHFLLGVSVSPPVIPLGVYVDGKYLLVFNNDEYETETNGILINAGLQIGI
ncbi:MAG: hypothetical protein ACQEQ4_07255 [Fibrobacterota bacterium]